MNRIGSRLILQNRFYEFLFTSDSTVSIYKEKKGAVFSSWNYRYQTI